MDASGTVYAWCKCGRQVEAGQTCECGTVEASMANELSEQLRGLVSDQVPDPLGLMRQQLIAADENKRRRKIPTGNRHQRRAEDARRRHAKPKGGA